MRYTVLIVILGSSSIGAAPANPQDLQLDTLRIERLTGAKGTLDPREPVFRVAVPRADLSIMAAGVKMTPPMGLTSWAAFKRAGDHVVVMGDLVLLEDQANPVMSTALDHGLEVTALHNHFFWDSPKVVFMHIAGTGHYWGVGRTEDLAKGLRAALDQTRHDAR